MHSSMDRRKVFFENLNPITTETSLLQYLSKEYRVKECKVPIVSGTNKGHAVVIFFNEENITKLMNDRPHQIDGNEVEVYRSVPNQGSLKEKKGVKNLIVSGIENRLSIADLKDYFSEYGTISNVIMNYEEESCCIQFIDYDSVDKAILDQPHQIHFVKIEVKKGSQDRPAKSDSGLSEKRFCVRVTNLPSDISGESLSRLFKWSIYDILIGSVSYRHSMTECWLKNVLNKQAADDFMKIWNGKTISGTKINCQIEEDQRDLCWYFQVGTCSKSVADCLWRHVKCSNYETCSSANCRYGHKKGVKAKRINNNFNETYRIKISGFQTSLTSPVLAQLLNYEHEEQCYVNPQQDKIGYIVKLNTVKLAQNLMKRWHDKELDDGHQLKCQLELNVFPSTYKTTTLNTLSGSNESGSYQRSRSITESSRDSLFSNDDSDIDRRSNAEVGNNTTQLIESIIRRPEFNVGSQRNVSDYTPIPTNQKLQLPSNLSADQWEISTKVDGSNILLIRKKIDRKYFAALKFYQNNNVNDFKRELQILRILKDTDNVSHLIDHSSEKNNLWMITERASGYSLKEFRTRIYHTDFELLQAIELIQKLLIIIRQIHSQGIFHSNLNPEHIMIEWDFKNIPIEYARLTLINFSQAYGVELEQSDALDQPLKQRWHQKPQEIEYNSTTDTSALCAIFLWLFTNSNPKYGYRTLPHQHVNIEERINEKIMEAIGSANLKQNRTETITQLKTYLIDTFNIGFSYSDSSLWSVDDFEIRLDCIRELLLPTNPSLNTTDLIFYELCSSANVVPSPPLIPMSSHQYIYEKASNAVYQAKQRFLQVNKDRYMWSDGSCTWMNNARILTNERRHDDILTYHVWNRNILNSYSIIITCFASVSDGGDIITVSIGSPVNGKMIRIPIGHYGKAQDYMIEFQNRFLTELNFLLLFICKQRKTIGH